MASFPLSLNQLSVWYLHAFAPDSSAYHVQFCARIASPLDVGRLAAALDTLVEHSPMLRTTISAESGTPLQTVHEHWPATLVRHDAAGLSDEELRKQLNADYERPFDLAAHPGFRASLYERGPEDNTLLLTWHHAFMDGGSLHPVLDRLTRAYAGQPLAPASGEYTDFVGWQRELMDSPEGQRQRAYWEERLGAAPPVLDLPPDKQRPPVQSLRGDSVPFTVDAETTRALSALARAEGSSMFRVVLAACHLALFRATEQQDILVGAPVAGRTSPEFADVIGHFVNMIVVRGDLSGEPTFRDLLRRVDAAVRGAMSNQDYPFAALVERLQPTRDASRSPLFQVALVFQRMPIEELAHFALCAPGRRGFELNGTRFEPTGLSQQQGAFDISLVMARSGEELVGELKYCSDLFERRTGERMAFLLQTLLRQIVADPDRPVNRIPLLDAEQQHQLVEGWNDTVRPVRTDACLHQLVEEQVARTPDAPAVVCGDRRLSYAELDAEANRIAHHLRAQGVGRHGLVGVYLERSLEMVPALLGVLKAGAGYVPLETSHPVARTDVILSSLPVKCVLTQARLVSKLQDLTAPALEHLICVDAAAPPSAGPRAVAGAAELALSDSGALANVSEPGDTAYIIFTSGSTGTPKGVEVAHQPGVNLVDWVNRTYDVGGDDRILQVTSLCFDLSVYDIFGGLAAGASLQIATADDMRDPRRLVGLLTEQPVTFWNSAPPALQQLVSFLPERAPEAKLRLVFLSGDWIPLPLPDEIRAVFPRAHVVSLGGATEATVWSNYYDIGEIEQRWVSIPYGRPIQNARYYVLDAQGIPCPVGIPGELYIGGDVLAKGYVNDPSLTASKFVPDPFRPGGRMYRTGDRARFYSDSNIEFLGRKDFQVKIRGYRIELGEIESVLLQHDGVAECLVLARDDAGPERVLVAYAVAAGALNPSEVRAFVAERLPTYMVPAHVVVLDAMPMTANGKIDRKALPPPDRRREATAAYVEPRDETERLIARTWATVLGLDRIGASDNFFELGGHSLQAVEIARALEEALGMRLPLSVLLTAPTVAELAAHLAGPRTASLLVPLREGSRATLFCFHPAGGEVLPYRELVDQLPDGWAVIGVQSRALGGEPEHSTLSEMADAYADALVAAQPDGRFVLAGWSMGGVLAHAVAGRLRSLSRDVAFVGLIDATLPYPGVERHPMWLLAKAFGPLASLLADEPVAEVLSLPAEERPGAALRIAVERGVVPEGTTLSAFSVGWEVGEAHSRLLLAHKASVIDVPLGVLWARESLLEEEPPTDWRLWTTASVETRVVGGDHYSVLRSPVVSAELSSFIEGAVS